MVPLIFWDAGSLHKRYVAETGSATVDELFRIVPRAQMLVTAWEYAECYAALYRKRSDNQSDADSPAEAITRLQDEVLTPGGVHLLGIENEQVLAGLDYVTRNSLHSADAAMLATYVRHRQQLSPNGPDCILVSADGRLLWAAQSKGFVPLNPERIDAADVAAFLDGSLSQRYRCSYSPAVYGRVTRNIDLDLNDAASEGNVDEVRRLIENGADANALDWHEAMTPLISAIDGIPTTESPQERLTARTDYGQYDVIRLLIDHGADVNRMCGFGTALIDAARKGLTSLVLLFLEHGANPNLSESDGTLPIHEAAKNGDLEAARALIAAGSKIHAGGGERACSVLSYAARGGHLSVVRLLIDHGVGVNEEYDDRTALDVVEHVEKWDLTPELRQDLAVVKQFLLQFGAKRFWET